MSKKNVWLLGGLLAATLALGCQVSSPMGAGQPRVVVHYGSMQLAPDADLAITLDLRSLLGTGYKVQQAGNPTVAKIVAKISGPNLAEPVTTFVNTIDCTSGQATLNFTNLPPGPVDVVVNALDAAGNPIAWASNSKPVVIQPGVTAVVDLVCSTQGGGLTINFTCGTCGGAPSPTPSSSPASPSPSPTPVATPTPVPSPLNPLAANMASQVFGLSAGSDGTVYLFAQDPAPVTAPVGERGRMLTIPSDLQSMGVILNNDKFDQMTEGSIFRINNADVVFGTSWGVGRVAYDLTNKSAIYTGPGGSGSYLGGNAIIGKPTDTSWKHHVIDGVTGDTYNYADGWKVRLYEYGHLSTPNQFNGPFYSIGNLKYDANGQAIPGNSSVPGRVPTASTMDYDTVNNRIIWASDAGILAIDYDYSRHLDGLPQIARNNLNSTSDPALLPTLLVNVPEHAEGMTLGTEDGSLIYFTKKGQQGHGIYAYDGTGVSVAWEAKYGYPYRIEKGLDGKFYGLIFEQYGSRTLQGSQEYRVIRFSMESDGTLTPELLMVDTMPGKPSSL